MKKLLCVAVAVVVEIADDGDGVFAPLSDKPLDELAARMHREARHGRDCRRPGFKAPGAAVAAMAGVCAD